MVDNELELSSVHATDETQVTCVASDESLNTVCDGDRDNGLSISPDDRPAVGRSPVKSSNVHFEFTSLANGRSFESHDNYALNMDDEDDNPSESPNSVTLTSQSGSKLVAEVNRSRAKTKAKVRVHLHRDAIEWKDLETKYGKQLIGRKTSCSDRIVTSAGHCCTNWSIFTWFIGLFPILKWMPSYSAKTDLVSDGLVGVTIAILHIPQGMAYGLLAGVGPIYGLYVSFFPVLIYAVMGTSRHISVGTFAVISIMLSNTAAKLHHTSNSNSTAVTGADPMVTTENAILVSELTAIQALMTTGLVTGILMLAMGLLKLGSLSLILSDQLVSAFSTGSAVHVATSQLRHLFDVRLDPLGEGPLKLIYTWINVGHHLKETNLTTLVISLLAIFSLLVVKEFLEPYARRKFDLKVPIPIDLLIIVLVTCLSFAFKFHDNNRVKIMGIIPTGLPNPQLPDLSYAMKIVPDCVAIAIISFAISLSLAKIYAKKHGYRVNPNQELIALGTANVISSFFMCYPCSASLSRSAVQERAGGKTQVVSIVSSAIILIVLLFAGPLFFHLPKCILASVILVALKPMFIQVADFVRWWKTSRFEGLTWLVGFLAVVLLDVDIGLLVGVIFSLLVILMRFVIPSSTLLGQLPNTEIYVDMNHYREAREIGGVKIFSYSCAVFFMNREHFKRSLFSRTLNIKSEDDLPKLSVLAKPAIVSPHPRVHSIIIDCSPISYLDSSGVETIVEVIEAMKSIDIKCYLASCQTPVVSMLERANFFNKIPYQSLIYPSVHDAVVQTSQSASICTP